MPHMRRLGPGRLFRNVQGVRVFDILHSFPLGLSQQLRLRGYRIDQQQKDGQPRPHHPPSSAHHPRHSLRLALYTT